MAKLRSFIIIGYKHQDANISASKILDAFSTEGNGKRQLEEVGKKYYDIRSIDGHKTDGSEGYRHVRLYENKDVY